jgi:multiple sugar transport system permease protein
MGLWKARLVDKPGSWPLWGWLPGDLVNRKAGELMDIAQNQQAASSTEKRPFLTASVKRTITGYIFIGPFILGFFIWFLGPTLYSAYLSMTEWNLISPAKFVGLANFQYMFSDKLLWTALKVTFTYTLIIVPLGLVLGFMLALLMNTKVRGIRMFRTIYYLPSIVPAVANAVLWAWIFNTEYGLLNVILRFFGVPKIAWLIDTRYALPAIILMGLWGVGGGMVIYLAGLQGIPAVYYEAAEIDGADRIQQLFNITIPLMSPVLFFNLIMGIIGSFQVFTAGYLLTNGGPENSTLFFVLYLYRNAFQFLNMGYAAALGWLLFFIILALTLIVFRYIGKNVYYEESR